MTLLSLLFLFIWQGQALTSFDILGTVRDVKGQAVSNVRISIQDENYQPIYTAFVDSSGRFTKRVRTGKYIIRIETTGTPYEEQQSGWIELSSLRKVGGASEVYPIDFTLKFRKGEGPPTATTPVFAQDVPKPALKEYEKATKELKHGKSDQAVTALKKAVELFPDYYDALEALGIEYVKQGQYDEAIPLLTRAVQINKRSARCLYGLGVAHLKLNRLPEAVEGLEKSAQLEPANANTQMMLGLAYGTGGAFAKSEAALKKALQVGGSAAAEAHFYLAGLYNKQEKYGDARQELEAYLKDAKNLKDPAQIKAMIENLKQKETLKASVASLPARPQTTIPVGEAAAPSNTSDAAPTAPEPRPTAFAPVPPLTPEYIALLEQSEKSGGAMHKKLFDYTYLLKKTKRTLNPHGKSVSTEEQVFEAYPIRGEHVLIKLSTNGLASKHVADERKRAVKELEAAERHKKTEAASQPGAENYLAAGITGIFQGKPSYVSIDVTTVLNSCEFFAPRLETINDRPMMALNFRPRAGMNLASKHSYLAKIVGTIWIDQADKVVVKMEGWPASKAAFDLIQSTAPRSEASLIYQQERQANGLWFPTLIRLNADGNFDLFDGLNWEVMFEFSKYQKFQTSADDLIVKPADKKP
jgi:tetratricopeptide (TPR) repeat protein